MMKVAVSLLAYNQEEYISQAIESVLAQKTNFEVNIIIGNDASTDSTGDIIKSFVERYPDKIVFLDHKENLGVTLNYITNYQYIIENDYKYVAILDGDDYWVDDYKLQKQFDFLENSDFKFVHTNNYLLLQDQTLVESPTKKNYPTGYIYDTLRHYSVINNCSSMFLVDCLSLIDLDTIKKNKYEPLDWLVQIILSKHIKFGFLEDYTTVYRMLQESTSHSNRIEKKLAYLDKEVKTGRYLDSLFSDYGFSEEEANNHRMNKTLEIAFTMRNYELAHKTVLLFIFPGNNKLVFWARNKFLFYLYPYYKKIARRILKSK